MLSVRAVLDSNLSSLEENIKGASFLMDLMALVMPVDTDLLTNMLFKGLM